MIRRALTLVLGICLAGGLTACGSDRLAAPTPLAGAAATGAGPAVTISSFNFAPNPLTAKVGDTITVTNKDAISHTMTANDGSFDTGPFSSASKTIHLTKAGTIAYHCNIHPFMTGTIQVTG